MIEGVQTEIQLLEDYQLESPEQIRALAETTRWRMLNLLIAKPMTGAQLARVLHIPRPRAHYHLKTLERVGLVVFVGERARSQMIERYYRAIARHFLSDQLLARARQQLEAEGDAVQAGEVVRQIIGAMLDMVKADIAQPNPHTPLIEWNYHYQNDIRLTPEQFREVRQKLKSLSHELIEEDRENQELNRVDLLPVRYTLLLTPALELDVDPGEAIPAEDEDRPG